MLQKRSAGCHLIEVVSNCQFIFPTLSVFSYKPDGCTSGSILCEWL